MLKHMRDSKQSGFSIVELVVIVCVVAVVALVGVLALHRIKPKAVEQLVASTQSGDKTKKTVSWNFNNETSSWQASNTPPACAAPEFGRSPVDMFQATGILYPGQYRGGNYKPHGGISFNGSALGSNVQVVMPMDAELTGLVRYIEAGELQYKLNFVNACGISFYFDHLFRLSPEFQGIAETTPAPREDTRGLPLSKSYAFKEGAVIATAIGHPATNNNGMDFGVLDLRKPNEISKNAQWAVLHGQYKESEWFGVCWFSMVPLRDSARIIALPAVDYKSGARSDYCQNSVGNTLQINGGKPA